MPLDALHRRLRFSRKRAGKRINLTERDSEIFKLLERYRYLRSTFIHAFVGGYDKRLIERLGDLFHEGYLNRPSQQWRAFNARYTPAIYELDELGERCLKEHGLSAGETRSLVSRGRMGANREFAHAMMISDTLASIELGARTTSGARFISWRDILSKAPQATKDARNPFSIPVSIAHAFPTGSTQTAKFSLVPDALFGLEYADSGKKLYRFFALEAERANRVYCNNLYQTSWLKKVLAYRQIIANKTYHSHFGLPNLMVMVVTPTPAKIETMKRLIMQVTQDRGSTQFLFKSIPVLGCGSSAPEPTAELFTGAWSRAGHPDFFIDRLQM
jgi:hypothetical protein